MVSGHASATAKAWYSSGMATAPAHEPRWSEDWVDDRGRTHHRGQDRHCRDHTDGIRHPAHEWEYARLRAGVLVIHYDCPGSTLGQYASRTERGEGFGGLAAADPTAADALLTYDEMFERGNGTALLQLLDEIDRIRDVGWGVVDAWRTDARHRLATPVGTYGVCADTLAKMLPPRLPVPMPVLDVNAADPVAEARRYAAAVESWAANQKGTR